MNRRRFLKLACLGGAGAMLAGYSVLIERTLVQINTYRIPVPGLPKPFHGFRIVHLTDIHLGPLVSESFVNGIIQKTNLLKPDAVACTGDYVNAVEGTEGVRRIWPLLMTLEARHGVFSILGNHDHWADTNRSIEWLERSGQSVRHTCKAITKNGSRIVFGGSGDLWEDSLNIDHAFNTSDENDCRILLAHNPDTADRHFNTPVSLILSGHTHGGQVSVPLYGPPVLPVENKRYSSGLISTPKAPLFISRGIGWTILPVRLNCYPEIAVLELTAPTLHTAP